MTCVSYRRYLGSFVVRKKEFWLKGIISQEEINLSRQNQITAFICDKSWDFTVKHVIMAIDHSQTQRVVINIKDLEVCVKHMTTRMGHFDNRTTIRTNVGGATQQISRLYILWFLTRRLFIFSLYKSINKIFDQLGGAIFCLRDIV